VVLKVLIETSEWGGLRGTHKVMAMPPVARMPQRIVLGSDIAAIGIEDIFGRIGKPYG
jgi:hypothetical protein